MVRRQRPGAADAAKELAHARRAGAEQRHGERPFVTQLELERAKKSLLADYVYDSDNQANLARRYGWAVAIGRSIDQVEGWPTAIGKVTVDDIKKVAA